MKKLRPIILLMFMIFMSGKLIGQTLTYTFVDPCTKDITYFSVPVQGGTVIFFLGQQKSFTAADVASGDFANWVNQVYADYRKVSPCSVQQGQVTQNQITAQIIGGTVQSVVGSIMSQAKSESSVDVGGASSSGGNDAAGKNNKNDEKKSTTKNGTNNSNGTSTGSSSNQNGGQSQEGSGTNTSSGGGSGTQGDGNTTSGGGSTGSGNTSQGGGSSSQPTVGTGGGGGGTGTGTGTTPTETKPESTEVAGTTTMSVDAKNDRGSDNSSSGGGGGSKKSGGSGNSRSNPIIVSSDLTNAQNLNKSYTGIINVGTSRSSLTGSSSWGVTSMIWFNLKQAAVTGRYTKIHYSKDHKLKLIHNVNLTGVYSYGNILGFVGYSAILNAGKWGITGANVSGAITKTPEDKNLFISPSITAFYTKPFKVNKKIMMSPELYVISTPLIYSSVDKVSVTDRTFSAFVGTGIDYQITKRFKVNVNYKANMSTNPSFPILSFFLIGSKINL